MMWFKCGNLGLLVAGAAFMAYKRKLTVVHCLPNPPPYPPISSCTGPDCPNTKWDDEWDQKDFYMTTAARHILLISSGDYVTSGESDEKRALTRTGLKQAQAVAHRLKTMNFEYKGIWYSPLFRAQHTALIIKKSLTKVRDIIKEPLLAEGTPVPPVPKVDDLREDYVYYQDEARMEAAFRKIFTRADERTPKSTYEIYVTHNNMIRYFVCRAMQFPPEGWLRLEIPHGSLTWIRIDPHGLLQCEVVGDIGWLPYDHITT